jgi:ribosomal protein S18 acetylase RimI-like enzyme
MEQSSLRIAVAEAEDAQSWIALRRSSYGHLTPEELGREIDRFNSGTAEVNEKRYLVWEGREAIASVELHQLGRVVEIRGLIIAREHLHERGVGIVEEISRLALRGGTILTAEYPEAYSPLFLGAGFRQNTRTRMAMSLGVYVPQPVTLPQGVRLRHPRPEDEAEVAVMAFRNYVDTADADMVSSSPEQAARMIRAMFGSEYSRFMPECSWIVEDEDGSLVGNCLVGDVSREDGERTAWVLDISIAPEWRGKGLGRAMLTSSLNAAREAGFERAGLIVTIGNSNAQALYRSLGFADYGELMYEGVRGEG